MALVRLPQKDLAPHEHPAKLTHPSLSARTLYLLTTVAAYVRQAALQLETSSCRNNLALFRFRGLRICDQKIFCVLPVSSRSPRRPRDLAERLAEGVMIDHGTSSAVCLGRANLGVTLKLGNTFTDYREGFSKMSLFLWGIMT